MGLPPVAEPALRLDAVCKSFGGVPAVDTISLDVRPGEFLTLLGPSGCGKTTTLNLIAGFEQPDAGHIHLAGRAVDQLPPFRRDIGLVFQDYALFPHMSVADNVGFGLRMRGVSKPEIATRVAEALALVRLPQVGARRPLELSGGQRQRVALARALVIRPTVLLLDEPLSNLDLKLREDMRLEIVGLQRRLGITTVLVTHDQGEALAVSDRIAIMNGGRIEQIGNPDDVYERPETRFVASFIGTTNFIPGTAEIATKAGAVCPVRTPGGSLAALTSVAVVAGQPVMAAVRPERLRIALPADGKPGISARVSQHVYLGNKTEVHLTLTDDTNCVLECANDGEQQPVPVGDSVSLTAHPADCRLFSAV